MYIVQKGGGVMVHDNIRDFAGLEEKHGVILAELECSDRPFCQCRPVCVCPDSALLKPSGFAQVLELDIAVQGSHGEARSGVGS
jgi:hypothetical protein